MTPLGSTAWWRSWITGRRALLLCGAIVALAVAHAVAAGAHYAVGSFDDDAGYILVARALAHGHGLTSLLPAGYRLVSTYPPGYSALLAPIALVDGNAFLAFRALSLVALAALLPLVWGYLGRRGLSDPGRLAVVVLLALNPVLATFSTMVMADVPFMVALVLVLLAAERWDAERATLSWAGAGTVAASAACMWTKEAAIGLVAGLVLWFVLRRSWGKAAVTAAGTAALFSPVLIARLAVGGSLIGSRYSDEFGGAFAGGLVHQLTSAIPHAMSTYANSVFPQSVAPTSVSPLPVLGPVAATLGILGTTVTPLVVIGFVVWVRHHRDAACVMVPAYLAETLVYPFLNERRLLLVLPFVVAWYVLGARAVIGVVVAFGRWLGRPAAARALAWAPAVVVVAVLVPQFGRDYLFALGEDSSQPQGSPYMALLRQLGRPQDVVESDYVWTTSLFSGHRVAESAYLVAVDNCYAPELYKALEQDQAAYFLSGALSSAGVGSPCLLSAVGVSQRAVRLFRTSDDDASVFELIGPGSPHPDLTDVTAGAEVTGGGPGGLGSGAPAPQAPGDMVGSYPIAVPVGGTATLTWTWAAAAGVDQVTVGSVGALSGETGPVQVDLLGADGAWHEVAAATGRVGDGAATPYLLAELGKPLVAKALRITVQSGSPVAVLDLHALASSR